MLKEKEKAAEYSRLKKLLEQDWSESKMVIKIKYINAETD